MAAGCWCCCVSGFYLVLIIWEASLTVCASLIAPACTKEKMFMPCESDDQELHTVLLSGTSGDDWDTNAIPFSVSPDPVLFNSEPGGGGQYHQAARVVLSCQLSCGPVESCPPIYWTFNGTIISGTTSAAGFPNKTTLIVNSFDSSKEGLYACHSEDHNYSISSYPVELSLPRFTEWSEEVYDVPKRMSNGSFEIHIDVSSHDAVILECNVKGNDPPATVQWSSQDPENLKLSNGNLLVKDFTNGGGIYVCTNLIENNQQHTKIYNIQMTSKVKQAVPMLVASPKSQEVPVGQDVFLYCLAHSNTTVNYQWYLNGEPVISLPAPQVMMIKNITKSGSYVCVAHNQYGNVSATAEVKVIEQPNPTISVVSSSVNFKLSRGNIDLVLKASLNINIVLNCSVDQSNVLYQWYFRGKPAEGSGSLFNISSSDADKVIGSIQCFVKGIGGQGLAYLRIVEDKLNPPTHFTHKLTNKYINLYTLHWAQPIPVERYSYRVQVYVDCDGHYDVTGVYEVNTSRTCVKLNLKVVGYYCKLLDRGHPIRVAAISAGRGSDYVYNTDYDPPSLVLPDHFKLTGVNSGEPVRYGGQHFSVALNFDTLSDSNKTLYNECDDAVYEQLYIVRYCCTENCTQRNEFTKRLINSPYNLINPHRATVNCDSSCYWRVGLDNMNDGSIYFVSDIMHFKTGDISPSTAGNLTNVTWIGDSGTQLKVGIQLPPMWQSCRPTFLTISCGRDQFITTAVTGVVDFKLSSGSCWDSCPLSFTYNNSMGMSPVSRTIHLPRPSAGNIRGFQSVWFNSSNKTSINVFWTLSEGMDCLLKKNHTQQVAFSLQTRDQGSETNCSLVKSWSLYFELPMPTTSDSFTLNLESGNISREYCVKVEFTIYDHTRLLYYTMVSKNIAATTSSSSSIPIATTTAHPPPSQPSSDYEQISTQFFYKTVLPVIVIVVIIVVCSFLGITLFLLKCSKKRERNRSRGESESLLLPDGSEEHVRCKPMDIDECVSETTKCERIESYLKDVSDFEDSCEETASKNSENDIFNPIKPVKPVGVQVITAEVEPMLEFECDEKDGKKTKMKKKSSDQRNLGTAIPCPTLLKRQDCETVQNASRSLASLMSSTSDWSDYCSHPAAAGPTLNRMESSYSDCERVELQEFKNAEYEDLTPTMPSAEHKNLLPTCANAKSGEMHLDLSSSSTSSPSVVTPLAHFQPISLQSPIPSLAPPTVRDTKTSPTFGLKSPSVHSPQYASTHSKDLEPSQTRLQPSSASTLPMGAPNITPLSPVTMATVPMLSMCGQYSTKGPVFSPHDQYTTHVQGLVSSPPSRQSVPQDPVPSSHLQQTPASSTSWQSNTKGPVFSSTGQTHHHTFTSPVSSYPAQKPTSSLPQPQPMSARDLLTSQPSSGVSFSPMHNSTLVSYPSHKSSARRVSDTACQTLTSNREGYLYDTGSHRHQQPQKLADSQLNARPSSQLSSGISSPSGSFESVFESSSTGTGQFEAKQLMYRHRSDCTSGIASPLYSPQCSNNTFQFSTGTNSKKEQQTPSSSATPTSVDYIPNVQSTSASLLHFKGPNNRYDSMASQMSHPHLQKEERSYNRRTSIDSCLNHTQNERLRPLLPTTPPPLTLGSTVSSFRFNQSHSSLPFSAQTSSPYLSQSDRLHSFSPPGPPSTAGQGYLTDFSNPLNSTLQSLKERSKSPDLSPDYVSSRLLEDARTTRDVTPSLRGQSSYILPSLLSHSKSQPKTAEPHSHDQIPEVGTPQSHTSEATSSSQASTESLVESYSLGSTSSLLQELSATDFMLQAEGNEYIEAPPS